MTKLDIGNALDRLADDVRRTAIALAEQYQTFSDATLRESLIKQAVDTPHRARAQIQAWTDDYDSRNGTGSSITFLNSCLLAAGSSKTLSDVNAELTALENSGATLVGHVNNDGWTWDQVANAILALVISSESFAYSDLPIPDGYVTVWGEPW